MGGSKGGKGGGGINVSPSPYEQAMATIANEYYAQTKPLRGYFLEDWGNFLRPGGGTTYNTSPSSAIYNTSYGVGSTPTIAGRGSVLPDQSGQIYRNNPQLVGRVALGSPYIQNSTDAYASLNPAYFEGLDRIMAMQDRQIANMQGQTSSGGGSTQPGGYGGMASSAKYNPYALPGYAPLYQLARGGVESQYNQARANVLGSSPRGGALGENLANLEMSRAQTAGALPAQIASPLIQDIMNKAYGAAFGAPSQSMSGLGGAASAYTGTQQAAIQQQALNAQQSSALGQGIGNLAAMGIKAAMK